MTYLAFFSIFFFFLKNLLRIDSSEKKQYKNFQYLRTIFPKKLNSLSVSIVVFSRLVSQQCFLLLSWDL